MSELVRIENNVYKDLKAYCAGHPLRPQIVAVVTEAVRRYLEMERERQDGTISN